MVYNEDDLKAFAKEFIDIVITSFDEASPFWIQIAENLIAERLDEVLNDNSIKD